MRITRWFIASFSPLDFQGNWTHPSACKIYCWQLDRVGNNAHMSHSTPATKVLASRQSPHPPNSEVENYTNVNDKSTIVVCVTQTRSLASGKVKTLCTHHYTYFFKTDGAAEFQWTVFGIMTLGWWTHPSLSQWRHQPKIDHISASLLSGVIWRSEFGDQFIWVDRSLFCSQHQLSIDWAASVVSSLFSSIRSKTKGQKEVTWNAKDCLFHTSLLITDCFQHGRKT